MRWSADWCGLSGAGAAAGNGGDVLRCSSILGERSPFPGAHHDGGVRYQAELVASRGVVVSAAVRASAGCYVRLAEQGERDIVRVVDEEP